jgi:hypothetical protein
MPTVRVPDKTVLATWAHESVTSDGGAHDETKMAAMDPPA